MRMKKLIFMFLAILLCGIVQAQTSEIILNNGKVVKGKIQSLSFNVDNTHEVRIKNEVSGEKFDYTSADVKEIKFYDKKAKEVTNWIPLYAQMGLGMSYKKAPKLYKNPVFLHPVYKGKTARKRATDIQPAAHSSDECAGGDHPISASTASVATFSPGCTSTCFTVPA